MSHGPSSPPGHRRGEDHIENRYRARRDRHTCRRPISCSRSEELLDLGILAAGAKRDGHVGGSAVAPEPTVAAVERRFQNALVLLEGPPLPIALEPLAFLALQIAVTYPPPNVP